MKDDPFYSGAPKPVDVEAIAREERRLVNELGTRGAETSLKEVGEKNARVAWQNLRSAVGAWQWATGHLASPRHEPVADYKPFVGREGSSRDCVCGGWSRAEARGSTSKAG